MTASIPKPGNHQLMKTNRTPAANHPANGNPKRKIGMGEAHLEKLSLCPTITKTPLSQTTYSMPLFLDLRCCLFDGSEGPDDHVQNHRATMKLHGATDSLMCMAFSTTLQKFAREWYNSLPSRSINSFKDPAYVFRDQFVASRKRRKNHA